MARYGGDEFIILMPETGSDQAQSLAERLRLGCPRMPCWPSINSGKLRGSQFPAHGFSAEDIIRVADAGMYAAKQTAAIASPWRRIR